MATNSIIEKVSGTDSSSNRIASTFYCTCSTAAATAQKEATPADSCVFNDNCLITGVTVFVSFTYTNTASTPTLKVGTSTAKQIMAYGTTKIGTSTTKSWYAGSVVSFTYNGTYWIQNDYKYDTDSNTYDRNRYQVNIKAGTTAITAGNIIVANSSNLYHHLKDGTAFDIKNPILYANADIAASSTGTNNYDIINFTVTTTQSITLTAYAPVFIKGTLSGTIFTPASTSPLTQTIPTSADSKYYMLLGVANSTTAIYLTEDHRIFAYKNGAFGEIVNDALSVNGYTVAKSVPSDAIFTDHYAWADITGKPTLGTAAAKDVPASGDASTTQVVLGNDSRLTNARTPTSHTHGNIQNGGTLQTTDITIATGDKLVVTDSSDSNKIARSSLAFDGSTATKCLTQKGTWEDFGNGTVTGVKGGSESTYSTGNVNITPAKVGAVDLTGDTMSGNLRIERTDPTNNAVVYLGNTSSTGINQYLLYNNGHSAAIRPETSSVLTDDRKLYIPDKSGTIATIDDITPYYVFSTLDSSTNVANSTQVDKPPNVQVTSAGVYLVIAHVQFAQNANGIRELRITQSRSSSVIGISTGTTGPASNVTNSSISESYIFVANKNDTFGLRLYQSSGGTLAATWRELQVYRLSQLTM